MLRFQSISPARAAQFACLPLLALAAVVPAAAAPHLPVPQASFLNYHAATVNELSQEVSVDPKVRARLANHFHISEAQMMTYIHNNLVLRRLDKTGVYRVACVRPDGSEYWVQSRLLAGTPVFASRATGQPILKLACGNPMVSALPPSLMKNAPLLPPAIAAVPTTLVDASINTPPALTLLDGSQVALVTPDDTLVPPVVQVSPSLQLLGGGGASNFFPALLGLGGAIAVFGHGGGSHGATPIKPITPTPPAVPEASTVTSLGMLLVGGSLLLILRRKTQASNA